MILQVSPDDESILQVNKKGQLTVSPMGEEKTGRTWTMTNAHENGVKSAAFIDNKTLMTGSADGCSVWSIGKQMPVSILDNPSPDKTLQKVVFTQTKSMKLALCIS